MNLIPPRTAQSKESVPPLQNGDRLTQQEFHRRYEAAPPKMQAELIGGIVYLTSRVGVQHGWSHADLNLLLGLYCLSLPGVELLNRVTTILSAESELQPDLSILILSAYGGQTRETAEQYIAGAPELVAEVALSSAAIELHQKRDDYQRAGVLEYFVWCLEEQEVRWFHFPSGTDIQANRRGVAKSLVFPGLWLDVAALLGSDIPKAMAVIQQGLASRPHAQFVKRLADAYKQHTP